MNLTDNDVVSEISLVIFILGRFTAIKYVVYSNSSIIIFNLSVVSILHVERIQTKTF